MDDRNESVGKKIREAEMQKVPYMLVVGEKEAKAKKVTVRKRGEREQKKMTLSAFLKEIKKHSGVSRRLFPSRLEDRHITETSIDHAVRNNLDHFRIPPFTPHDLRRTASTHMAMNPLSSSTSSSKML